jgi:hypothetical protein
MSEQIEALNRNTRDVQRNTRLMLVSVLSLFITFMITMYVLHDSTLSIILFTYLMIDILVFITSGLLLERKGSRIIEGKF